MNRVDVNDGRNEIVAIDRHNVMIYKKEGKKLRLIGKFGGKSYDRYLSVDVADIDTKQIYVTSIQNGILNSFVLRLPGREVRKDLLGSKMDAQGPEHRGEAGFARANHKPGRIKPVRRS